MSQHIQQAFPAEREREGHADRGGDGNVADTAMYAAAERTAAIRFPM